MTFLMTFLGLLLEFFGFFVLVVNWQAGAGLLLLGFLLTYIGFKQEKKRPVKPKRSNIDWAAAIEAMNDPREQAAREAAEYFKRHNRDGT